MQSALIVYEVYGKGLGFQLYGPDNFIILSSENEKRLLDWLTERAEKASERNIETKFRSVNVRRTRYVQSGSDRSSDTSKMFTNMKLNTTRASAVEVLKLGKP